LKLSQRRTWITTLLFHRGYKLKRTIIALSLFLCLFVSLVFLAYSPILLAAEEIHYVLKSPTEVTIHWRGDETQVNYSTTSGALSSEKVAGTPSITPTSSSGPFREAKITGLTPATTYYYRIGEFGEYSFKTPPSNGTADFNIYALGNVGTSIRYPKMYSIQTLIGQDNPAFVLMLGDLAGRNKTGKLATQGHFKDVMPWSVNAAYMPVWGDWEWKTNTNESFANYKGRFDVPNSRTSTNSPLAGGKDWYWFDYGNTRFITLPDITWSTALTEWLVSASVIMSNAQSDANIKHIVTASHRPAYTSGYYLASASLKEAIDTLGDAYNKYQLNLTAHSGNYERSSAQHGVVHVTVGTGGADLLQTGVSLYRVNPAPAWTAYRAMHLGALKLNFVDDSINGTFRCGPAGGGTNDVTCDEGTTLDTFSIGTVANPGPTLTSITASNVTQTAADISWSCGEPCTGQTNYGLTTDYGTNSKAETSFTYSGHTQHLASLTAGTTYHYRVRSTNNAGVETISDDATFETVAPTPDGPVLSAFSTSEITTSSAKLNWACNEPCKGWYEIGTTTAYGTTNNPGQNNFAYSAHSQLKTGLASGTLYHWRAHSTNEQNVETISPDQTFTTLSGGSTGGLYHAPAPTSSLVVNVRNTGATGNGTTNDTAAIQTAINQVGGTGGTVLVPAGTYRVDALAKLILKSNMTLKLETGAVLKAIPNSSGTYFLLYINGITNVNIVGGKLQGERHQHGTPGDDAYTTPADSNCPNADSCYGQWGMGVGIYNSSNIYIEGTEIREMWGDATYVSNGNNINFYSIISDDNRRQGVSLIRSNGVVIRDSVLKNTYGHKPQAGVDFEPNTAGEGNFNVQIINNTITGNRGSGLQMSVPARLGTTAFLKNATVTGNTITGNGYVGDYVAGIMLSGYGAFDSTITGNTVTGNTGGCAIQIDENTGSTITNNTIGRNTNVACWIRERFAAVGGNVISPNNCIGSTC
jgi:hypothetical protein